MVHICMIRHGETDWNRQDKIQGCSDIPLNETGLKQAHITGRYVSNEDWDYIYASPLSRAYETASIIAGYAGIREISTDPRLKERHFGEAEGMDVRQREIVFGKAPIPGAETWEEVQLRGSEAMNLLAARHPGSSILVVTHGGLIGRLLSLFSQGDIVPGNTPLKNLSMSMFIYDGSWRIAWYNRVTPELEQLYAARQN